MWKRYIDIYIGCGMFSYKNWIFYIVSVFKKILSRNNLHKKKYIHDAALTLLAVRLYASQKGMDRGVTSCVLFIEPTGIGSESYPI